MLAEKLEELEEKLELDLLETQNNIIGFSKNEQLYYLNLWHGKNTGYITRAVKEDEEYEQWHYHYDNFPISVGEENIYLSMNTFNRTYRRIECLEKLNAVYIDIDYYHTKHRIRDVLKFYQKFVREGKIPPATVIIKSGSGLYLEWKIESADADQIGKWQEVENHFASLFKAVGADMSATDVSRILRLPGTVYLKKGKKKSTVDLLDFQPNFIYSLENLAEYVPEYPEIEQEPEILPIERKKRKQSRIAKLLNIYTLHYTRIMDLVQLCELRNWNMKYYRELTLFLYRYWSICFYKDAELAIEKTLELNAQFILPLSEREATNSTMSAGKAFVAWESEEMVLYKGKMRRKGYNYTNERLIELFDITEEEQKHMRTIIGTTEKYRRSNEKRYPRNEDGLTSREQKKQDMLRIIRDMLEQGLKQTPIAQKLNISKQLVGYYVRELKK